MRAGEQIAVAATGRQATPVSVIVPAYNAQRWLDRCLRSVLEQDYPALELVVVNDGSRDSTALIIDAFAERDPRVRAIHQPNKGVSEARRAGLDAASGVWIQFLDADDELLPGAIGALVARAEQTGADLVAEPFIWCYTQQERCEPSQRLEFDRLTGTEYFGEMLRERAYWTLWSNFHRKSLYEEQIRIYPHIAVGEDCLWMLQLLLRDPVVVALDRPIVNYHVHPASALRGGVSDRKKYRDLSFVHESMHDMLARKGVEAHFGEELLVHDCRILLYGVRWGSLREQVGCARRAGAFLAAHPQMEWMFNPRQLRFAHQSMRSVAAGYLKALFYRMRGLSF